MSNVKKNPASAPALIHGLNLMETVQLSAEPLSFSDLLEAGGVARSTLIRLLRVLVEEGWLAKEKGGYVTGARLQRLRQPVDLSERLRVLSEPLLESLMHESGNTAGLFLVEGDRNIMIQKRVHPAAVALRDLGSTSPVSADNPWGWIMLQDMSPGEQNARIPQARRPLIENAWQNLEKKGWCLDDQVGMDLVCRMAVPLWRKGSEALVAVLALGGNPLTMPPEEHDRLGALLVKAAEQILRDL